jgi:hypothetical protein
MAYMLQYREALVSIGGDEVTKLLKSYLPDRGRGSFGLDAARALYELWRRDNTPSQESRRSGPDFSEIRARRQVREAGAFEPASPGAQPILAVIDGLIGSDPDEAEQRHALQLAAIALSMPYGERNQTIGRLLTLPQPPKMKREFLTALILAGESVSADLLLEGIRELVEEAKSQPWRLDPHQGPLHDWFALLPFSEQPTAVMEALASLPPSQRDPRQLGPLLSSWRRMSHHFLELITSSVRAAGR